MKKSTIQWMLGKSIRLAKVAGIILLLSGCSALVGKFVTVSLYAMKADGVTTTYSAPAMCSDPQYSIVFKPDAGVAIWIKPQLGGSVTVAITVQLQGGTTFAFIDPGVRIASREFGETVNASLAAFTYNRAVHEDGTGISASSELIGPSIVHHTNATDRSNDQHSPESIFFESKVIAAVPVKSPKEFTMQLPQAVVNGKTVIFPPITFSLRKITYFQSACLR